jgi:signal transduction histidine kinase
MTEILSDIPTFLIALLVGALLEAIVIWFGLVLTGLATTLTGLVLMSFLLSAVWLLLPTFAAVLIGTILFYFLALKFTDAEGFVDVQLLIVVMNLVSILLQLFVFVKVMQYLPNSSFSDGEPEIPVTEMSIELNRPPGSGTSTISNVVPEEVEQPMEPRRSDSENAYDAYSAEISQEERDRIDKLTSFSDELANEIQQGR